jgi:ubiquinone/menaquinone biosynthesis C-methylase UbiE
LRHCVRVRRDCRAGLCYDSATMDDPKIEQASYYGHTLHYRWLNAVYDPVTRWLCRERNFKTALVRQTGIEPGDRVLDLACGTGTLAIMLKTAFPLSDITGLDGSAEILAMAADKAAQAGVEISFVHGLSYDMPLDDETFDRVTCSFFFHHLRPDEKVTTLEEVARLLKAGGQLHVADWGAQPNPAMRSAFALVQLLDGFETTRDSVEGKLPEYMRDCGFAGVEETGHVITGLGSVSLYQATRPRS